MDDALSDAEAVEAPQANRTSDAGVAGDSQENMENRLERAEFLLGVSHRLAGLSSLDDLLEAIVDMVTKAIGAERSTLFLNDDKTGELYSRIAQGDFREEIRFGNTLGIAGHCYATNSNVLVNDAYEHHLFNRSVDEATGFVTRSILAVPIRTVDGQVIGVVQSLNKIGGDFSEHDSSLMEAMATQAAVTLKNAQMVERMEETYKQALEFLDAVTGVTTDIDLNSLLDNVIGAATRILRAERSVLFLYDTRTRRLWSEVSSGSAMNRIRVAPDAGVPGLVFQNGQSIRLDHAYADLRFDPKMDELMGCFTRSLLCVPVTNRAGSIIGVTYVINKRGGTFTSEDESWLKAFSNQVAIGVENAKLFNDIQSMKNYNDAMLQSMTNGIITVDEHGVAVTINMAARRILRVREEDIVGIGSDEFFSGPNKWVAEIIRQVNSSQQAESVNEAAIQTYYNKSNIDVNMTVLPLVQGDEEKTRIGAMLVFEDVTSEKRIRNTMARYVDPMLANTLMKDGGEILGGKNITATVLFSDIRNFVSITDELGAQGTVSLLNEYFTLMVECIQNEGGILDKFIGDAIMAGFGIPLPKGKDEDGAVRAAIRMLNRLEQWNEGRVMEGRDPLRIGIGINTDTVISGNIGSARRMDYTLIGEGVNLASRIESVTKRYGAPLLISNRTLERLDGNYMTREVDRVVFTKGARPITLYEVMDHYNLERFPNMGLYLEQFAEAREAYRALDLSKARRLFSTCAKLNPEDGVAQLYQRRCAQLMIEPPEKDWDGVWQWSK